MCLQGGIVGLSSQSRGCLRLQFETFNLTLRTVSFRAPKTALETVGMGRGAAMLDDYRRCFLWTLIRIRSARPSG